MKIEISLPIKDTMVNQGFGMNYVDFYKKMGLIGHPGIDFRTEPSCPVRATHDGIISWCGYGRDGGIGIEILNEENRFKTFYYHHLKNADKIQKGIKVANQEKIALADNTGKYTTRDHLHFEIYKVGDSGETLNRDNGYGGSEDPAPYFTIGKHYNKSNAYHRYGRKRVWIAEYWLRFAPKNIKNRWTEGGRYIHKTLKRMGFTSPILSGEQVNAIVYGGWDLASVLNSAMYRNWGFLTKQEFKDGQVSFLR